MVSSQELAQQIADYDKNKKSSADIMNSALTSYGVPEIRNRVSGLRTTLGNTEAALNAVDPSVTGRTSQSLVTEAQRQRMVAKEREPIASQYGDISRTLGTESANLNDAERSAREIGSGMINDYNTGRQALQSRYESTYGAEQNAIAQETARQAAATAQANVMRKAAAPVKETKNDVASALTEDITSNLGADWRSRGNFWTEKTLIPELMKAYPELSEKDIKSKVYALRKQYE